MNEKWGVDPACCESVTEWQLLLKHFGPFVGRYIYHYPIQWKSMVEEIFKDATEMQKAKIESLLIDATNSKKLFRPSRFPAYDSTIEWHQNWQISCSAVSKATGVLLRRELTHMGPTFEALHDMSLSCGRSVRATADELAAACEAILLISPLLHFVDPKFCIGKGHHREVITRMLSIAANQHCARIQIWTRENTERLNDAKRIDYLHDIKKKSNISKSALTLNLVDDSSSVTKMHDRYVFGPHGGVEFGQGFQYLPQTMSVKPMAPSFLNEFMSKYNDKKADFKFRSLHV